jgi:hypothetical protein
MDAAAGAAFARVVPAFVLGAPHHARARRFGMPQSSVAINYRDAPGDLAPYRDMLKTIGLLEEVRDFTAQNFVFPQRITLEAKTCGEANAFWYPEERRIALCYEFLAFHADLALQP